MNASGPGTTSAVSQHDDDDLSLTPPGRPLVGDVIGHADAASGSTSDSRLSDLTARKLTFQLSD